MSEHSQPETPTDGPPVFAAFVAIDWTDQRHAWAMQAAGTAAREHGELEHRRKPWRSGYKKCSSASAVGRSPSV